MQSQARADARRAAGTEGAGEDGTEGGGDDGMGEATRGARADAKVKAFMATQKAEGRAGGGGTFADPDTEKYLRQLAELDAELEEIEADLGLPVGGDPASMARDERDGEVTREAPRDDSHLVAEDDVGPDTDGAASDGEDAAGDAAELARIRQAAAEHVAAAGGSAADSERRGGGGGGGGSGGSGLKRRKGGRT